MGVLYCLHVSLQQYIVSSDSTEMHQSTTRVTIYDCSISFSWGENNLFPLQSRWRKINGKKEKPKILGLLFEQYVPRCRGNI